MDDELDLFAAELKRLHPTPPSDGLRERVAQALDRPTRRRWTPWLLSLGLPAAAAAMFLLGLSGTRPRAGSVARAGAAADLLRPVGAENVLYARNEQDVTLQDGTPARRESLEYIDTIRWQNPRTHATLTWTLPREEVRVVPVRYQ